VLVHLVWLESVAILGVNTRLEPTRVTGASDVDAVYTGVLLCSARTDPAQTSVVVRAGAERDRVCQFCRLEFLTCFFFRFLDVRATGPPRPPDGDEFLSVRDDRPHHLLVSSRRARVCMHVWVTDTSVGVLSYGRPFFQSKPYLGSWDLIGTRSALDEFDSDPDERPRPRLVSSRRTRVAQQPCAADAAVEADRHKR
jgi:hypothetical protein